MRKSSSILLVLVILAVAVGILGWVMGWLGNQLNAVDRPLAMPASGEIDERFQFSSAWQSAQIPLASRFDPPLGTEHGGLVYNAQKFWDLNESRGGHHTGDDLNGIGGMNTDFGDPVFSAADGLVLYTGEPSSGWGNVVVIAHKTADGRILHTMYAHMSRIDCLRGSLVARGGKIGAVGTANGHYPAHLHFEMRASSEVDIGAGYASVPLNRINPMVSLTTLRNAAPDDLSPSPLARVLKNGGDKASLLWKDP